MEQVQKLYAAKTVSWPGATPFCPPLSGPNPLRGFGGHTRPRCARSARALGLLPRTRIQDHARNSSEVVCRALAPIGNEIPCPQLKPPEPPIAVRRFYVRIEEPLTLTMKRYAEFVGIASIDHVVTQALEFIFKRDSQFNSWLT